MNNHNSKNTGSDRGDAEIFIDPSYSCFLADGLFNLNDPVLNRDDQLLPFHRMREHLMNNGRSVHTADYLSSVTPDDVRSEYYSLGILENFNKVSERNNTRLAAFVVMEPPVVVPELYAALPELTEKFDRVYVHNVDGDGYSLERVNREKLRRLYWPIPYAHVLERYWSKKDRAKRIVVINGNHKPLSKSRELYSARIKAMVELSKFGAVDLYGRNWNRWWSRASLWIPYWRNRRTLMSIYKGACESKFEVLQQYQFCLCFENMAMDGYITEKIFDCLYAGTIPLYLGASDISKYIPSAAYIDCRKFSSVTAMWHEIEAMPESSIEAMREAGRSFFDSELAKPFFHSIEDIVGG
jgi:hypothetical protein